jgi:hypothetical protein
MHGAIEKRETPREFEPPQHALRIERSRDPEEPGEEMEAMTGTVMSRPFTHLSLAHKLKQKQCSLLQRTLGLKTTSFFSLSLILPLFSSSNKGIMIFCFCSAFQKVREAVEAGAPCMG